jgi:hypothetical protein
MFEMFFLICNFSLLISISRQYMQSCYAGWPNLCLATVGTVPRQFSFYLDLLLISPAKTLMQAVHRTFPNIFTVVFFSSSSLVLAWWTRHAPDV